MMKKKRTFTLIEIVVVLALVAVVAATGLGLLKNMLEKHRLQSGIEQFKSMLLELQVEALALQSDMEIHLTKGEQGWVARSKTAESILQSETIRMKEVEEILVDGVSKESFHLTIFSTGRVEPAALIEIQGAFWIDLREPIQIKFSQQRPAELPRKKIPLKPVQDLSFCRFSILFAGSIYEV